MYQAAAQFFFEFSIPKLMKNNYRQLWHHPC